MVLKSIEKSINEMRQGIPRHEMIERDRGTPISGGLLMTGHRIETEFCVSDDGETFEVYDGHIGKDS